MFQLSEAGTEIEVINPGSVHLFIHTAFITRVPANGNARHGERVSWVGSMRRRDTQINKTTALPLSPWLVKVYGILFTSAWPVLCGYMSLCILERPGGGDQGVRSREDFRKEEPPEGLRSPAKL